LAEVRAKRGASLTEKTVTCSIRISKKVYDALQKEAKERDQSFNTLINQVLRFETEFAVAARRVGAQVSSRATWRALLDSTSEESLSHAGTQAGANAPRDFIVANMGQMNLENVLSFMDLFGKYGRAWEYNRTEHEGGISIVLSHVLGKKYSLFLSDYFRALFESIGLTPDVTASEASVIIKLRS
jgi:hypothetical protein